MVGCRQQSTMPMSPARPRGGIGRHDRLKICYPQGCGSSSLPEAIFNCLRTKISFYRKRGVRAVDTPSTRGLGDGVNEARNRRKIRDQQVRGRIRAPASAFGRVHHGMVPSDGRDVSEAVGDVGSHWADTRCFVVPNVLQLTASTGERAAPVARRAGNSGGTRRRSEPQSAAPPTGRCTRQR